MYKHVVDDRVFQVDILRLRASFRTRDAWEEMMRNLRQAIDSVCRDPRVGEPLRRSLGGWLKFPWASKSVPDRDPWPDMRLIYRLQGDEVRIFAVGRRMPGDPNDIYRITGQRIRS